MHVRACLSVGLSLRICMLRRVGVGVGFYYSSVLVYILRNHTVVRVGEPRTATSTFTQLQSSESCTVCAVALSSF